MKIGLMVVLVVTSLLTAIFVVRKIKKSQFKIGDTLFWLVFAIMLLVMSFLQNPISKISHYIGFESPANFIFVAIIFLLLVKIFLLDVRLAKTEEKLIKFAQKNALNNENKENNS